MSKECDHDWDHIARPLFADGSSLGEISAYVKRKCRKCGTWQRIKAVWVEEVEKSRGGGDELDDRLRFNRSCPHCGEGVAIKLHILGELIDYHATLTVEKS
jgi:ribosomal protein S27AE